MTSVKIRFRASRKEGSGLGRLTFRFIYRRQSREIVSSHQIHRREWDTSTQSIKYPPFYDVRHAELKKIDNCLKEEEAKIQTIIDHLSAKGEYTLDELVVGYKLSKQKNSFYHFILFLSKQLKKDGKERTSRAYQTTCRRLVKFNRQSDFSLDDISPLFIQSFEKTLKAERLEYNTISFYLRNLRAIYNKAVLYKYIAKPDDNPFAGTSTGVKQTKKKALSIVDMSELIKYDLAEAFKSEQQTPKYQELSLCKDLFTFSFYARGMSFVDIAYLKKSNIKNGVLTYYRRKTGQKLSITITAPLASIVKRYTEQVKGSIYVFPIIKDEKFAYVQYQSGLRKQNLLLKEFAQLVNLDIRLSTHVARHSWATIAKKQNISIWEISESLGHSNIKTTYIYLGSFEQSKLDEANERVALAVAG